MHEDRAVAIAAYCRRVAKRRPPIPYGVVYDGGKLTNEGMAELSGMATGLTCATFVLAALKWAGYELLELNTWSSRAEDDAWHSHIVKMLIAFYCDHHNLLSTDQIVAVARERGCARFRPEEVAAACALRPWPVAFRIVEPEGIAARTFLLSAS